MSWRGGLVVSILESKFWLMTFELKKKKSKKKTCKTKHLCRPVQVGATTLPSCKRRHLIWLVLFLKNLLTPSISSHLLRTDLYVLVTCNKLVVPRKDWWVNSFSLCQTISKQTNAQRGVPARRGLHTEGQMLSSTI